MMSAYNEEIMLAVESARNRCKASSAVADAFYELYTGDENGEVFIYDEDENGHGMSYGEYGAVQDYLLEVLEEEVDACAMNILEKVQLLADAIDELGDDELMFMGLDVWDREGLYFDEETGDFEIYGDYLSQYKDELKEWLEDEYIPYLEEEEDDECA